MNMEFPVYTTPNECQDCYKCVRHCICKAIRIVNARAAVIPDLCVSCGECVKVCPAHAKKIRSDLSRAKYLIESGEKVYASIAPSFIGYFKGMTIGNMTYALKRLGFAGVSETALGAQLVSAQTAEFLAKAPDGVSISSACPAVVDYITKYHSDWTENITPVVSPVMAHARYLKHTFGNDIKVVFFGPCAAKKNESDKNPGDLALALTFPTLEDWLDEKEITLSKDESLEPDIVHAEEGRLYSLEGGMNDTIRAAAPDVRFIAVSGLDNISRLLEKASSAKSSHKGKLFIEALACAGGCVNGPAMRGGHSNVDVLMQTFADGGFRSSGGREVPVDIYTPHVRQVIPEPAITQDQIREALESVGKYTKADELNCGGCGYNTCREFAKAKLEGKAEASMCVSYLKKISQKTSNALIKYIPAGVVIADSEFKVLECNRHFAELCGSETLEAYELCGSLAGATLDSMIEFTDLFETVMANGGELERFNQMYGERIFNISVFAITPGRTAGAVVQDVTTTELHREQIAEKARQVIRENVLTVQKIARDLGEHMAKTEILLDEVAGTYESHNAQSPEK